MEHAHTRNLQKFNQTSKRKDLEKDQNESGQRKLHHHPLPTIPSTTINHISLPLRSFFSSFLKIRTIETHFN